MSDSPVEQQIRSLAERSELAMDVLELVTAFVMVGLFTIGVVDLGLKLYTLVVSGNFVDPDAVIGVIDTALLLMIIVEIYRTVVAYVENLNILPIVLNVGLIAMARKIISFRTGKYGSPDEALMTGGAYGLLLLVLVVAFYLVHRSQEMTDFDIYSEPESTQEREAAGAEATPHPDWDEGES